MADPPRLGPISIRSAGAPGAGSPLTRPVVSAMEASMRSRRTDQSSAIVAALLASGLGLGPAGAQVPPILTVPDNVDDEEVVPAPRPAATGVPYQPFSGGLSGLPQSREALPGETIVLPRSGAYLPSLLPLPERLGAGRGVRVGSFALQSATSTGLAYDDNINADDKDREGDFIWSINQYVRAQSLFRRHSLGFQASAGTGQYFQHRGESEINWLVGTDGRLDFTPNSSCTTAGFHWRFAVASDSGGRVAGGGGASVTRRARPPCRAWAARRDARAGGGPPAR